MSYKFPDSSSRHKKNRAVENVLVLQGGGSLGAFACGVFKALVKEHIKIDVVAGTSIGAINGAIIAGSKSSQPEVDLENFWMELAESSHEIIPNYLTLLYDFQRRTMNLRNNPSASANAAAFGVPKMFLPRWNPVYMFSDKDYLMPQNWTYYYDNTPLVKTLEKYIDYEKLVSPHKKINKEKNNSSSDDNKFTTSSNSANYIRLVITAVNVLTAEPLVFDSDHLSIVSKHLLASCGYPNYGFPWVEIEKGVYGWDGSLLSNTPVREVIGSSPRNDKNIFIVENYSREIDRLPANMTEVLDRAKDIMFSDKTLHNLKMAKVMTRQIQLIERLYEYFEKSENKTISQVVDSGEKTNDKSNDYTYTQNEIEKIRKEYKNLVQNRGAEILSVTRIVRSRVENPNVSKNADFSVKTIKQMISEGERKTLQQIKQFKENNEYNCHSHLYR
jgi:NTE family protein